MMILDSIWFTEMGSTKPIGIVFTENSTGERKAYIGVGEGKSQVTDQLMISQTGAKFTVSMALSILSHLNREDEK